MDAPGEGNANTIANDTKEDELPHEVQKLLQPLWIASLITHRPCVVLGVTMLILIIMMVLDSFVFALATQNDRAYLVESDYYVTNFDMMNLAIEAALSSDTDVSTEPQSEAIGWWNIFMMFELDSYSNDLDTNNPSDTDYWILTKENLDIILEYERKVTEDEKWIDHYCLVTDTTTWDCNYFSVANTLDTVFNYSGMLCVMLYMHYLCTL